MHGGKPLLSDKPSRLDAFHEITSKKGFRIFFRQTVDRRIDEPAKLCLHRHTRPVDRILGLSQDPLFVDKEEAQRLDQHTHIIGRQLPRKCEHFLREPRERIDQRADGKQPIGDLLFLLATHRQDDPLLRATRKRYDAAIAHIRLPEKRIRDPVRKGAVQVLRRPIDQNLSDGNQHNTLLSAQKKRRHENMSSLF